MGNKGYTHVDFLPVIPLGENMAKVLLDAIICGSSSKLCTSFLLLCGLRAFQMWKSLHYGNLEGRVSPACLVLQKCLPCPTVFTNFHVLSLWPPSPGFSSCHKYGLMSLWTLRTLFPFYNCFTFISSFLPMNLIFLPQLNNFFSSIFCGT